MADRIRSIKPTFWTDGRMVRLSPFARLLYIGTWNFALCDNGHLPDDPEALKLKILPADDVDIEELLAEIMEKGRIVRITAGDRTFLHIIRLPDHQKVDSRWSPRCPACKFLAAQSTPKPANTPADPPFHAEPHQTTPELAGLFGNSPDPTPGGEGRGGERKGEGGRGDSASAPSSPRPPRKCPKHIGDPHSPNCGACKDARLEQDEWDRAHPPAPAGPSVPIPPRTPDDCPRHPGYPHPDSAHGCPKCTEAASGVLAA